MISVSGLGKHFGDQTLFEGVTLQFNPGERYGLVGANGCGKSTLLEILSYTEDDALPPSIAALQERPAPTPALA